MSGRETANAGARPARARRVSLSTKAPIAVELLRAQHGEENARKIALQEQRKARRARSRRHFEFWSAVVALIENGNGKQRRTRPRLPVA